MKNIISLLVCFSMLSLIGCQGAIATQEDLKLLAKEREFERLISGPDAIEVILSTEHFCNHALNDGPDVKQRLFKTIQEIEEINNWLITAMDYIDFLCHEKKWTEDQCVEYISFKLDEIENGEDCSIVLIQLLDARLKDLK